jgi:hypothetical protein
VARFARGFIRRQRIPPGLLGFEWPIPVAAPLSRPERGDGCQRDRGDAELNGRPRETLNWATPAGKMQDLLLR